MCDTEHSGRYHLRNDVILWNAQLPPDAHSAINELQQLQQELEALQREKASLSEGIEAARGDDGQHVVSSTEYAAAAAALSLQGSALHRAYSPRDFTDDTPFIFAPQIFLLPHYGQPKARWVCQFDVDGEDASSNLSTQLFPQAENSTSVVSDRVKATWAHLQKGLRGTAVRRAQGEALEKALALCEAQPIYPNLLDFETFESRSADDLNEGLIPPAERVAYELWRFEFQDMIARTDAIDLSSANPKKVVKAFANASPEAVRSCLASAIARLPPKAQNAVKNALLHDTGRIRDLFGSIALVPRMARLFHLHANDGVFLEIQTEGSIARQAQWSQRKQSKKLPGKRARSDESDSESEESSQQPPENTTADQTTATTTSTPPPTKKARHSFTTLSNTLASVKATLQNDRAGSNMAPRFETASFFAAAEAEVALSTTKEALTSGPCLVDPELDTQYKEMCRRSAELTEGSDETLRKQLFLADYEKNLLQLATEPAALVERYAVERAVLRVKSELCRCSPNAPNYFASVGAICLLMCRLKDYAMCEAFLLSILQRMDERGSAVVSNLNLFSLYLSMLEGRFPRCAAELPNGERLYLCHIQKSCADAQKVSTVLQMVAKYISSVKSLKGEEGECLPRDVALQVYVQYLIKVHPTAVSTLKGGAAGLMLSAQSGESEVFTEGQRVAGLLSEVRSGVLQKTDVDPMWWRLWKALKTAKEAEEVLLRLEGGEGTALGNVLGPMAIGLRLNAKFAPFVRSYLHQKSLQQTEDPWVVSSATRTLCKCLIQHPSLLTTVSDLLVAAPADVRHLLATRCVLGRNFDQGHAVKFALFGAVHCDPRRGSVFAH